MSRVVRALAILVVTSTFVPRALAERTRLATLLAAREGKAKAISTITTGSSRAVDNIAASYPAANRDAMRNLFAKLLETYPRVERAMGVQEGDLVGAVALFAVASYAAYTDIANASIDDATVRAVVDQLRGAIATSPALAKMSMAERRELYETTAALGLFMLGSQPSQQRRDAAKGYIASLGVDPEAFRITSAGIAGLGGGRSATTSVAPASPQAPASVQGEASSVKGSQTEIVMMGAHHYQYTDMMTLSYEYGTKYVVMFRGGDALVGLAGLADPAAYKRDHPSRFTSWRKHGSTYQYRDGKSWVSLELLTGPLPAKFRLSGTYSTSSIGNVPGQTVTSWKTLTFDKSGRFTLGGGMGSTTSTGTGEVTTSLRDGKNGGSYEISGFTLTLRFDDGRTITRTIMATPDDLKMIYIDGKTYRS